MSAPHNPPSTVGPADQPSYPTTTQRTIPSSHYTANQQSPVSPSGSRVLRATPARAHRRNTYTLYPIFSGASSSRGAERPLSRLQRLHDAFRAQRNRTVEDSLAADARRNASRNSLHSLPLSPPLHWAQPHPGGSVATEVGPQPMEDVEYENDPIFSSHISTAVSDSASTHNTGSAVPTPSSLASSSTNSLPSLRRSSSVSSLPSSRTGRIRRRAHLQEVEVDPDLLLHRHHHQLQHGRPSMEARDSEDSNQSRNSLEGANPDGAWGAGVGLSLPPRRTRVSGRRLFGPEHNTSVEPDNGNDTDGRNGDGTSRRLGGGMRQRILSRILTAAMTASAMNLFGEPSTQTSGPVAGEPDSTLAGQDNDAASPRRDQLRESDPFSDGAIETFLALLEGRHPSMLPQQRRDGGGDQLASMDIGIGGEVQNEVQTEGSQLQSQGLSQNLASAGNGSPGSFLRFLRLPSSGPVATPSPPNDNTTAGNDEASSGTSETRSSGSRGPGIVPVIIIGIRSVPRPERSAPTSAAPFGRGTSESSSTISNDGSGIETQIDGDSTPTDSSSPVDGARRHARSWIVYIIGGSYPSSGSTASAASGSEPFVGGIPAGLPFPGLFSDNPSYEELLMLQMILGPARPVTTTQGEIDAVIPTQPFSDEVKLQMMGDSERCQVCLADYCDGEQVRVLKCHHGFHTECIDKWLTEGSNKCPICRGTPVEGSNGAAERRHGAED
ncbi:hypothetical protein BC938DRAFT_476362, partial [Jimgerdemannia flammicorona]